MPLARLLLARTIAVLPVLFVVALLAFLLMRIGHGDPAAQLAGDADQAAIAAIRSQLGLDQPWPVQFMQWCWRLLQGDLGTSVVSGQPVMDLIAQRLGPTLAVSISTLVVSVLVGVPIGMLAAWSRGGVIDQAVLYVSIVGFAVPAFALGYFWIYVFATTFELFPVQGYVPLSEDPWSFLWHLALPTLTLSLVHVALIARVARASLLEVLSEDFIRTARSKGLPEWNVFVHHALPNAMIPIVSMIGIALALLVGGVVVTESVFNLPGLGRLTVESVMARDYPVIQGIIIVLGAAYVGINLVIDLSYGLLDPRVD